MGGDDLDINSHKGDLWNEVERLRGTLGAIRDVIDRYDWDDPRLDRARGTIGGVELHLHLLDDAARSQGTPGLIGVRSLSLSRLSLD